MQLLKNPYNFWAVLIIANLTMYVLTIAISYSWSKIFNLKTNPLSKQDLFNSLVVFLINILVAIPGYWLYKIGQITFTMEDSYWIDFLILVFIFDITMYSLHLASHHIWPFKKFHKKHHTHTYFNAISLYVMEPVESVLFGLLLTVVAWLHSFNLLSFIGFLYFNWLFGVIAHLNTNSTKQPLLFGNHIFHKTHHQHPNSNYGFYTLIWDKIFGTIFKN